MTDIYAPIRVKNRINGIKNVLGIVSIFAMYGIRGKFKISKITFPIYIDIITDQKISGWSCIKRGPGETFRAINAPSKIAVVPDPGIPRVKSGTNVFQYKLHYLHSLVLQDL